MARYCFGVDVGGTTVKMGIFDTDGTVMDKWEIPTRTEDNGSQILPDVAVSILSKIKELGIHKDQIEGIGIGVPGPVNERGEVPVAGTDGQGGPSSCHEDRVGTLRVQGFLDSLLLPQKRHSGHRKGTPHVRAVGQSAP